MSYCQNLKLQTSLQELLFLTSATRNLTLQNPLKLAGFVLNEIELLAVAGMAEQDVQ